MSEKTFVARRTGTSIPHFRDEFEVDMHPASVEAGEYTWIRVPGRQTANTLEVTVRPVVSARERKLHWLRTNNLDEMAAGEILAALEAIDREP